MAQQILDGSASERSGALETARSLGSQNLDPELRRALIRALERQGEIRAQRYHAGRRGENVQQLEDPEFIARLSRVVAELRDPSAIPALAGALGTSATVTRALASFGEAAVPALVSAVRDSESIEYVVEGALMALRFMIEGAGPRSVSDAALAQIRDATMKRLTGKQYFTTLWEAIDLASELNDTGLKRVLQSLASDRDAVLARGIQDPELIDETQTMVAKRLAGIPPEPRWR